MSSNVCNIASAQDFDSAAAASTSGTVRLTTLSLLSRLIAECAQ